MPIYHDNHGDSKIQPFQPGIKFKSASNACFQAMNLYILYDSLVVSSFLSDQNQQQICADFQQSCARIIETLHEIQEEEDCTDPVNEDLSKLDEERLQNYRSRNSNVAEKTKFHQSNPEFPSEIHEGKIGVQYLDSTISELENEPTQISDLTKSTKPDLNSDTNRSQFQRQNDEDEDELDERRLYHGSADWSATIVVQRPPPEQPDLYSVAVGGHEPASSVVTAEAGLCRTKDLMHSGAEDGAIAKGNVDSRKAELFSHFLEDDDTADLNCGGGAGDVDDGTTRSAEVDAFQRAERSAGDNAKRHRERRRSAKEKEGQQLDSGERRVGSFQIFDGCHKGDPCQRTSFLLKNGNAMETGGDEAARRETITHRGSGCSGHGRRRSNHGCLCAWNVLGRRRGS
ncbi:hypothetical protein PIB30_093391 [Stylosanthes scabra]|uniref:Uncharacterized protein n=1 Tax=Stylosanthes scabra TaxID=79078 RepID=A0ABU6XRT2_9FABA|nr:hypothetical protein [Stylosanthes scabra]